MSYKKIYAEYKGRNNYLIHLWDEAGYDQINWKKYAYEECSENEKELVSLEGIPVKKIFKWDKTNLRGIHFHDMPAYQHYLIERYSTNDEPSIDHRELFFDIEAEMGDALTPEYIKSAPKKITSIAFYDRTMDRWGVFILDIKKKIKAQQKKNRDIYPCHTEKELLIRWLEKFREIDPDILVGYNSNYYDIPYMYYRMCSVLGEDMANYLSPIGIVQDVSKWSNDKFLDIAGVESLDYMQYHKKYYWRDEPSWTLDSIGKKWAKLGKVEYDGSLDRLYERDLNKFIDYNFRDVEIIVELDKNLEYIPLTKNLAHKGKIRYGDVISSSKIHDGAISAYLLSQGIVPPSRDPNALSKKDYAGGYLFCPDVGLFKYLFDEDLTSLYPSIIRSLNIGKETYVARIIWDDDRFNHLGLNDLKQMNPNDELTLENSDKKYATLKISQLIQLIEDNNFTISANGVLFRTDIKSVLSVILGKWFNERKENQKLKKQAYKSNNGRLGKKYHLIQYSLKILLNSLYGALALGSFRYGNVILSEAITLSGQRIIQESALFANTHMNKVLRGEVNLNS